MELQLKPFALVQKEDQAEDYARLILTLVRAFAQRFPISQGMAHSFYDGFAVSEAYRARHTGTQPLHENTWWLNVYGPSLVERFGRQYLLSSPSSHIEELPGGAILILTRPTPADFDSEPARLAQARLLAHIHPEHPIERTLPLLRERSLLFDPLPIRFDEDVADILHLKLQARGLLHQRQLVEQFNSYHPPAVSEWFPASQALSPDVDDVPATISLYEGYFAWQLVPYLRKEIPNLVKGDPALLPRVDFSLWHFGWGRLPQDDKELLIPALGAWLGLCLVHSLGGQWLPRRSLDEAAVRVGDRLWLPFLRARHALQGSESPLDSSCSQLFRLARRLAFPHSS